jgi:two-component system response regulator YesN
MNNLVSRQNPDYLLSLYDELASSAIRSFYELCTEGAELVRRNSLSEGQKVIYEAINYMKSRLSEEITVGECAAQVHLSTSYFSSLFKKVTGVTVTQYVTSERIQRAKLLLVGGAQVQEVASAVGYEVRRYFSEMFKKITGQTPSEFRAGFHPDRPEESYR